MDRKNADSGRREARVTEKSGRKSGWKTVKRATRVLDDGRVPQLMVELLVLLVRMICSFRSNGDTEKRSG